MSNNQFSVLDMAQTYAIENDIDPSDLFKKSSTPDDNIGEGKKGLREEMNNSIINMEDDVVNTSFIRDSKKEKRKWTPDSKLIEDMPDLKADPVTYTKEEIKEEKIGELENIVDDNVRQSSDEVKETMNSKLTNIEDVKKRFGIRHLQIPKGSSFEVSIHGAAGDPDSKRAREGLDEIFREIVNYYPEFVMEWIDSSKSSIQPLETNLVEFPTQEKPVYDVIPDIENVSENQSQEYMITSADAPILVNHPNNISDLKVIINKAHLPEITWTKEEIDKIRRSRSVELNIVEDINLRYTNVEDIADNAVDAVLSQYQRKVNDISGVLPASKYRATFTGLYYTEIMDLQYSQEMNDIDSEKKKWSIAFDHIKNPSIGPWREYKFYIDPITKKRVELHINALEPIDTLNPTDDLYELYKNIEITKISKFDDFLMKTSYLDLKFILWKILCATAMEKEIISIDCGGKINGMDCKRSYDWIYSPKELLLMNTISPQILEEMKKTGEVSSKKDIEDNYKGSMLLTNNTVELPTSKLGVVFGHISAYEYLNSVFGKISSLQEQQNPMLSQAISYRILVIIKAFIIPKEGGGNFRVKGVDNFINIINTLDEIDWETLAELARIMLEPYDFKFALRQTCCQYCKTKSDIPIEDISRLLFILAQSLSSVQVVLKRT